MAYRIGQVGDFILYAPTYKDAVDARALLDDDPQQSPATLALVEALICDRRPVPRPALAAGAPAADDDDADDGALEAMEQQIYEQEQADEAQNSEYACCECGFINKAKDGHHPGIRCPHSGRCGQCGNNWPCEEHKGQVRRLRRETLVEELTALPVRQVGGAAHLKERNVMLVAKRGDALIKGLRSEVRRLKAEVQSLRKVRGGRHA